MDNVGLAQSPSGSDTDLAKRVTTFLLSRGVRGATSLRIESHGGVVTLHGQVASQQERGLCVSCSQRVAGVLYVIDDLQPRDLQPRDGDERLKAARPGRLA